MGVNASIWKRVAAVVFDLVLLNIVFSVPIRSFFLKDLPQGSIQEVYSYMASNPEIVHQMYMATALFSVILLTYFAVFEWKLKQTPGKMLLKIKVEMEDAKLWKYYVRAIPYIPLMPFFILLVIDVVFVFNNKDHKRLMERITGSKTEG